VIRRVEEAVQNLPTHHELIAGDARTASALPEGSVHLVVTSPPYWTLKRYNEGPGQLGHVTDYDAFMDSLDEVWSNCYRALVPGGRLIVNVGDVCLSRRKNNGRHTVVPLHASIQLRCRRIGYDNLAPIIWHKISNAAYEAA
jgi:DNA modification methylase